MKLRQCGMALAAISQLFITTAFARPSRIEEPLAKKRSFTERSPPIFLKPKVIVMSRDTKYFHEPGGSEELGHYDIRYFKGEAVTYEERDATLRYMIRAYLTTFRELGIETWIAHGTLLGWWWNGKIMPWDWDLDVQVASSTLDYLGEHYNMTLHRWTDTSIYDGTPVNRTYLLDINPNSKERVRGDGQNVIDARWIDVSNGLFIDITGLAETKPDQSPGEWSCKNYHRYQTKELYPMRQTSFEGVPASIPYEYEHILVVEYNEKALTKTHHMQHTWDATKKEWVKDEINAPKDPFGDKHKGRSLTPEVERTLGNF